MRIERHLVITAASRMQTAACLTDRVRQTLLDIHMDIFKIHREIKAARVNLLQDILQPLDDCLFILIRDDPAFGEHRRMGDAAGDILMVHPLIEAYGGLELIDHLIGGL